MVKDSREEKELRGTLQCALDWSGFLFEERDLEAELCEIPTTGESRVWVQVWLESVPFA